MEAASLSASNAGARRLTIRQVLLRLLMLLVTPLCTLMLVEMLNQNSLTAVFTWVHAHPGPFLWSLGVHALIYAALCCFTRRVWLAAVIWGGINLAAGLVNHYMYLLKGEVFLPRDVLNYRAAQSILPQLNLSVTWIAVAGVAIFGGLVFLAVRLKLKPLPYKWYLRIPAGLALVALAAGLILGTWDRRNMFSRLNDITGSQSTSVLQYRQYGFTLSTAINLKSLMVEKPRLYSRKAVELLGAFDNYSYVPVEAPENPNIIVVMGEAWSDTRHLNHGITFERDPFAPLSGVESGSLVQGDLLVAIHGGSTCNTEFEFLTGSSIAHLPLGTLPYQHYLSGRTVYGLPSALKELGYQSVAVHPYTRNFWRRDTVYPLMGIDTYCAIESFPDAEVKNVYVSDQEVYRKITSLYEQRTPGQPFFCMTVTMQNHGTYRDPQTARDYPLSVKGTELSEVELMELKTHTAGVEDTAQLVRDLIDYFAASGEPTVMVAFGDHHPRLGVASERPGEPGAAQTMEEFLLDKYVTPFYIWTSYEAELEEPDTVGASFLASHVLRYAGIDAPDYFKLVYEVSQSIDGFNPYLLKDAEGNLYENPLSVRNPVFAESLRDLKLLQYDMIFGKQYGRELFYQLP